MPSIEFVIGVAVGGRATLLGPALGAVAVAWAQTALSERFPGGWTYFEGLLFVVVVAFLPGGLASLRTLLRRRQRSAVPAAVPLPRVVDGIDAGGAEPIDVEPVGEPA